MGLPQANLVLFFLAGFVALWGVSVVFRGLNGNRDATSRRCPQCRTDMRGVTGRRCPECAFDAASERDLHRRRPDRRVVAVGTLAAAVGCGLIPVGLSVRSWETTGYADNTDLHPLNALFAGVAAFALVLLVWAVRGDRAKGRRRCPECWYDMRGTLPAAAVATDATDAGDERDRAHAPSILCPECGHTAATDRDLYRSRRRPRLALLAVAIVLLSLYGQTVPRALRTGPLGLVPTTVLIGGMRWLPEGWYAGTSEATLSDRLDRREAWGWQIAWADTFARRMLIRGGRLESMETWWQLLTTDPDEIAGEVMCGLLARVLEGQIDWETCSGYDLWVTTFSLSRRRAWSESAPDWSEFHARLQANRVELLVRLDRQRPDEAVAVLGLLAAGEMWGADVQAAVIKCLQSPDQSIASAARSYLYHRPADHAELFDPLVALLRDPAVWSRRNAAQSLLEVGRQAGQIERVVTALDAAARDDPDAATAAFMLCLITHASRDPKTRIREWNESDAFSKEVRLESLYDARWRTDSESMLHWISPAVESATPAELSALIQNLGSYPLVSATARDGFVALIDRCIERGDQDVIDAAYTLRNRIESADPSMTTDGPW